MASDSFRLAVIGLDSVSPDLLYRRFASEMPRFQRWLERSARGILTSCDPPITVPAWAVMFSGYDPGSLGLYGFRHRYPGSYDRMYTPTSQTPRQPMIWQTLSRLGKKVAVVGMSPGYPPPALNGVSVSDFLTPDSAEDWVRPIRYRDELDRVAGGRFFDIDFRVEDRARVAEELFEMTRRRWRAVRYLWAQDRWDLFAVHDIGPDRLHHTFWKFFDEHHPRFEPGSPLSDVARRFYRLLDEEMGEFLEQVGPEVRVMIVSDHGSQAMAGCFCVNEWLRREGYLTLKSQPDRAGTPLESCEVDWARTSIWAAGGYYARFFFNVQGRETEGRIAPTEVPSLTAELRQKLDAVRLPNGLPLGVRLFAPRDVYAAVTGDPPDLMAYFGEVRWRSAGTLGHGRLFLEENDTGPDDAVHSFDGVVAWNEPGRSDGRELPPQRIVDVAPTVLHRFGVPIPTGMQGRPIRELLYG